MLALEDHIEKAIKSQLADLKDYPGHSERAAADPSPRSNTTSPIFRMLSDRRNAGGCPVDVGQASRAPRSLGRRGCGLIDLVRHGGPAEESAGRLHRVQPGERSATSCCYTTALALGDQEVADLARQHFRDYAEAILPLRQAGSGIGHPLPPRGGTPGDGCSLTGEPGGEGGVGAGHRGSRRPHRDGTAALARRKTQRCGQSAHPPPAVPSCVGGHNPRSTVLDTLQ